MIAYVSPVGDLYQYIYMCVYIYIYVYTGNCTHCKLNCYNTAAADDLATKRTRSPSAIVLSHLTRCRRSSSTQEQRYPPPLPLGATAPPTCGRRESDPGLGVTTQEQEYPLRKLPEIRDINLIAGYL